LIIEQSELDSVKQVYGDSNVRVRAARARMAELQRELAKLSGTSAPLRSDGDPNKPELARVDESYPSLRQIPRLAVPYADIYRRVRVREAVYEMLTQQYEVARIQEAKEIPVVRVIDVPGIPEKKSFPPRALLALLMTAFIVAAASMQILLRLRWGQVRETDPRKALSRQIAFDLRSEIAHLILRRVRAG
jgi:capsule polysaccharide export protein KpsE/RkpR